MSRASWCFVLVAVLSLARAKLFADLRRTDIVAKTYEECGLLPIHECLWEYHGNRFDGSQMHRSMEFFNDTAATIRPRKIELLLLITSVWPNFQRRRLLRRALTRCWQNVGGALGTPMEWHFLLGKPPPHLLHAAMQEAAEHPDVLLLGSGDAMDYSHIGDAYELQEANPELTKIALALRQLRGSKDFNYLMVVDDDSFVNIPATLEVLDMVPAERVYIGNMIDSIPQRFDPSIGRIRPEYSVNLYLAAPSRVPVFAHGMGFIVSSDVARVLADLGLEFKSRGNDDMLIGLWLRSFAHMYFLHYWPFFVDHEDFGGAFARPCDMSALVVHRMNAERWRRFDAYNCHVCDNPVWPLDPNPDEPHQVLTPGEKPKGQLQQAGSACVLASDLACDWPAAWTSAAKGLTACVDQCVAEGALRVANSTVPGQCPPSICHTLCQPQWPEGPVCAELGVFGGGGRRSRPQLAVLIFGSSWADRRLRMHLRRSLQACSSKRFGISTGVAPYVFVMSELPVAGDARHDAARELLVHQDLVVVRVPDMDSATAVAQQMAQAWRVAEERFGGAEYLVLADHRAFVNVPLLVHMMLPQLRRTGHPKLYVGCLVDETLYGTCTGTGLTRCDYLWRRRAPLFAHGMGFLVSAELARSLDRLGDRMALRAFDMPADVAFGMWVQIFEGVAYESVHASFHEWPNADGTDAGGDVATMLSLPLAPGSAVVFPMTPERWRHFDKETCTLHAALRRGRPTQTYIRP